MDGLGTMENSFEHSFKILLRAVLILTILAVAAVLIVARAFFYPVFLAVLLSYLLYPLAHFFEKRIKHCGIATLLSIFCGIAVFVGSFLFLSQQLSFFLDEIPEFQKQALSNLTDLQSYISRNSFITFSSDDWLKDQINTLLQSQESFLGQVFNATTGTLVAFGVQPVYVFFILYYRSHFRKFLFKVTQPKDHPTLEKIIVEVSSVTNNYVTGIFIVVLILCVINSVGLMIVGLEYAVLFGIISALLNFIPYFGTLIGATVPLLYALVSPEPSKALGVIILFIIVQVLENNFLTPNITGGRVAINPLFTIFAIILGGLAWGIPGMFLSVPFLGIFKVVCQNVEPLKPIAFILSSKEE